MSDFEHLAADYVAADTVHGMAREPYVAPTLPPSLRRAVAVAVDDPSLPQNARKIATLAASVGWPVRVTTAHGYDSGGAGGAKMDPIKEPTGELTKKTNKPAMKTVGYVQAAPVHSFRVSILTPDGILYNAHWVDDGFDSCIVTRGRTFIKNAGWTLLDKELKNAASAQNLRGEGPAAGREPDQLSLDI